MQEAKDVVCGMTVEVGSDAISTTYESREFFFCSEGCRRKFAAEPREFFGPHAYHAQGNSPCPDYSETEEGAEGAASAEAAAGDGAGEGGAEPAGGAEGRGPGAGGTANGWGPRRGPGRPRHRGLRRRARARGDHARRDSGANRGAARR